MSTINSISIIIPAFNVEEYLNDALDSIKNQIIKPDEVILIDDGSTDNTLSIAQSYKFPFPYKVISTENGGQGNARNIGVSLASSDYVYFFDSDDLLNQFFIQKIKIEIQQNKRPDIIFFSGQSFNDDKYQGERWVDYSRRFSGYFQNRVEFLDKAVKNRSLFCSPCLYVSKRSLWGEKGLKFGSNYREDEAIFFPLIFSCKTFCVLDEFFFYRRNREGSTMTMRPTLKHVAGALNCIETTIVLYQLKDLSIRERWHIRQRLGNQILAYINTSRKARIKIEYFELLKALLINQSLKTLIKSILYALGLDEIKQLKRIKQLVGNPPIFSSIF